MAGEEILRAWEHAGSECVLWRDGGAVIKGGVRRAGVALATVEVAAHAGQPAAERAVEALAVALREPRGPWLIDGEPVADLVMAPLPAQVSEAAVEWLDRPFPLAADLVVQPVSAASAELIYQACDPPGINRPTTIDLRGHPLYAFARLAPAGATFGPWDGDERLQTCIALSRLVRPTSISLRYAVRVVGVLGGDRYSVRPGPVRGFGAAAWTATPERDWLATEDFVALRALVAAFDAHPFGRASRLARAFWYFEYAMRTRRVDLRWPLVSTALETLVGTGGDRVTQQFIHRLPALASAVGRPPISNRTARRMWGLRSAIVHGEKHGGLRETDFEVYGQMEDVLREALRRALTDLTFRHHLDSKAAVDAAFPLPAPTPRTATCGRCGAAVEVTRREPAP